MFNMLEENFINNIHVLLKDAISLLTFSFPELKIAEVISILSPTVKFLIPASIFYLSKKMK